MKTPHPRWFENIYNRPVYLRLYEEIERGTAAAEACAAARLLDLQAGERVLDLACGYGRHVAELERLGFRAFGVDLSAFFLNRAAAYAAENRLSCRYVRAGFAALPFGPSFAAATSFFLSFGYLADQENALVLAQFAAVLRPTGRLLMDTWNAERVIAGLQPKIVEEREDAVITERSRYVAATRRVEWWSDARFRDGSRERWGQSVRAYTPAELRGLFHAAGFKRVRLFGDWDGSGFAADSPRLLLLGRLD